MNGYKHVLITGCTPGGIGLEAAVQMVKYSDNQNNNSSNYLFFLSCRDKEKLKQAKDIVNRKIEKSKLKKCKVSDIDCIVDLASLKSTEEFGKDFIQKINKLDILINNAGVMAIPTRTVTKDGFEMHLQVNYLSHFLLTSILIPLLLQTSKSNNNEPSRVINVSSDAHTWVKADAIENIIKTNDPSPGMAGEYSANFSYGLSKLFQIYHTAMLQKKYYMRSSNEPRIYACSVHPGVVTTQITRNITGGAYGLKVLQLYGQYINPSSPWAAKTVEQGSMTTVHCATMKQLPDVSQSINSPSEKDLFQYYDNSKLRGMGRKLKSIKYAEEVYNRTESQWLKKYADIPPNPKSKL